MWHDVPGFDEVQVTADGRVRIKPYMRPDYYRGVYVGDVLVEGGERKVGVSSNGYLVVGLRNRDETSKHRQRPYGLHVLMCRAFHGEPPEGKPFALHRDGNRLNCEPGNLYWGSGKTNAADRKKHGMECSGELSHFAKLTAEQVAEIRAVYKPKSRTHGAFALAKEYGVHRTSIENIVRGTTWSESN